MQGENSVPKDFERSRISPSQRSIDEIDGEVRERVNEFERERENERRWREYRAD